MRHVVFLACAGLALAGGAVRAERLVVRTDFDIPASWSPRKLMGHDFLPSFLQEYWTANRESKPPPLPMYSECIDLLNAGKGVNLYRSAQREGQPSKTNYAVEVPESDRFRRPYTFAEAASAARLRPVDAPGREKMPFLFQMRGDRPSFLLDASYPLADRESYRAWRAAHPNCIGAQTLGEWDQQAMWYRAFSGSTSNKTLLARLRESFPLPRGVSETLINRDVYAQWLRECVRREREFYFGEESLWGLHSGTASLAPCMLECGMTGVFYESTPQGAGTWVVPGAYARGASRQFDAPFGWYVANFMSGYTRDGRYQAGENSCAISPPKGYQAFGRGRGASRSLMRRQMTYGWLIGANILQVENWYHYHRYEVSEGKFEPSAFAKDMQELVDRAKREDRGAPYTPIALLCPLWERFDRSYWNRDICDPWSLNAFSLTLEAVNMEHDGEKMFDLLRRRGDEACFRNSPFGGVWDIVCPDATRTRGGIGKTLAAYKAAFVVGDFRAAEMPRGVLERYVRGGGTLFVSADKLGSGLVSPAFAGVEFGKERVRSGDYSLFVPVGEPKAVPFRRDSAGNVVVWRRDVGKGRIVTVACDRMLPDAYARCSHGDYKKRLMEAVSPGFRFELVHDLLEQVQRETLPVAVDGDVQWGVNRTANGWLVWMFNNKGVVKFVDEPEQLDESMTAAVTVRCRGREKSVAVEPGGIAYVRFEEGE